MRKKITAKTMVTSATGKKVRRSECKLIKNKYYIIGNPKIKDSGECYMVEGTRHRFNNGYIDYDHNKGCYVLSHKTTLRNGIIDFDIETGLFIKGLFSPDPCNNIILCMGDSEEEILCMNENIARKGGYREKYNDGKFYNQNDHSTSWFRKLSSPPLDKNNLEYDSRYVSDLTQENYNKFYSPLENNEYLNEIGDWMESKGYTYGLEFETTKGYIPERLCHRYGLIPLRDGSVAGLEYVTIPLSGRKGLYALREICKLLKLRTRFDSSCALHVHIGGLSREEESICSAFILTCLMQDEQFLLQPKFKSGGTDQRHMGYCKKYPIGNIIGSMPNKVDNIKSYFKNIFAFISDGRDYGTYKNSLDNIESHPSDPSGERKWQIDSRYYWLNYVPLIFGNKKTIEFRHNSITNDFDKVLNILFGCALFIESVETNKKLILNGTSEMFKDLLKKPSSSSETLVKYFKKKNNVILNKVADKYIQYINVRKDIMSSLKSINDSRGDKEQSFDKQYKEIFNGIYE